MDTVSISRELDDAEITDSSTTEGPSQEAPQRYERATVCGYSGAYKANCRRQVCL